MEYPQYADVYFSMSTHSGIQQSRSSSLPSPSPQIEQLPQNIQPIEPTTEQHSLQDDVHHLVADPPWALHIPHPMASATFHPEDMCHSERGIAGFVSKLYQSLQAPDNGEKYARWCRHDGKDMFIIDCIPKFTEIVLPRLFKHCKFASFVRQLNIYGFQRDTDARKSKDTKDKESCRWYHPQFQPGRRDLFHLIRRKATRYSRRKRARSEKDPETILNMDSADDSDTNDKDGRRSSSVSSEAISIMQTDYPPQQQARFHAPSQQFPPLFSPTKEAYPPHTIAQLTPTCSSSATSPSPLSAIKQEPSEIDVNAKDTNLQLQPPATEIGNRLTDMAMSNQAILHEQELRIQLAQLKRSYQKMHRFFTEQINRAYGQIEEQKRKIEELESSVSNVNAVDRNTVRPTLDITAVTTSHGNREEPSMRGATAPSSCMTYTSSPTDYMQFLPSRITFPPGAKAEPMPTKMELQVSPRPSGNLDYGFMFPHGDVHQSLWDGSDLPLASTRSASAVAVAAAAAAASTVSDTSPPSGPTTTPQEGRFCEITAKYNACRF